MIFYCIRRKVFFPEVDFQGVKARTLGRQNERNFCYESLALNSIFGLCFMPVCLIKSNCYSLIHSSLILPRCPIRSWDCLHLEAAPWQPFHKQGQDSRASFPWRQWLQVCEYLKISRGWFFGLIHQRLWTQSIKWKSD